MPMNGWLLPQSEWLILKQPTLTRINPGVLTSNLTIRKITAKSVTTSSSTKITVFVINHLTEGQNYYEKNKYSTLPMQGN